MDIKSELPRELETGVAWQDKQHRELYSRLVKLVDAIEHNAAVDEALRLLDFLDEYVVVHFDDEERAMSSSLYPEMVLHVVEHHGFIEQIEKIRGRFEGESVPERLAEVKNNITEWLVSHIGVEDKKLGQFLLKAGKAAS